MLQPQPFNAIKTGFQAGRDVEGMQGRSIQMDAGAVSDIKNRRTKPKTTTIQKLFASWFCRRGVLQTLNAKKKTEDMREQLKNIIMFSRGVGAWEELRTDRYS